jgi:hypothetical protein
MRALPGLVDQVSRPSVRRPPISEDVQAVGTPGCDSNVPPVIAAELLPAGRRVPVVSEPGSVEYAVRYAVRCVNAEDIEPVRSPGDGL